MPFFKKITILTLLSSTIALSALSAATLNLTYQNLGDFKLKDRLTKDRGALVESMSVTPITLINGISEKNSLDYLSLPSNIYYTRNMLFDKSRYGALLERDDVNEAIEVSRADYADFTSDFTQSRISGFIVNKKYMIFIVNFSTKRHPKGDLELETIVRNLKKVIDWSRKYFYIDSKNIIFAGSFGLDYIHLQNKLPGFKPLIKNGTKMVKTKRGWKLSQVENILVSNQSNISAEVNFFIKKTLQKGKFSKDTDLLARTVSRYYPISIKIKDFKAE